MLEQLKPYAEYKDSSHPWLGAIPAHWQEKRAKYYFREVDERSVAGAEQLMSVSHITGVTPRKKSVTMFMAESNIGHKICRPGDLVINTMWAWMAALGVAHETGVVSPSYGVYRPNNGSALLPGFVDYLLRTEPYKAEYLCRSTGIRPSRLRLYPEQFLRIPIICPPREDQELVLCFLVSMERKVRRFIRNRRRLMELLNEQKQAIVTHAVTRGLDPTVPLKPSGIDWLDDVPAHWQTLKIKQVARLNPSRSEAFHRRDTNEEVVFLPMERVSTQGEVDAIDRRPINNVWEGYTYFRRGDVVLAKITPCFENGKGACLSELPTDIGFGTTEFIVLRPTADVTSDFLYQVTQCAHFRLLGVEYMTGAAGQQRVPQDFVANFVVPVPPKDEQEQIVKHINAETKAIRAAIDRASREIDLIQEYRTRLIAEVVTGKVDVQHLAAELDDEADDAGSAVDLAEEAFSDVMGDEAAELAEDLVDD